MGHQLVRTLRSYAVETEDGDLHHVRVLQYAENTGMRIQVRRPVVPSPGPLDARRRDTHVALRHKPSLTPEPRKE